MKPRSMLLLGAVLMFLLGAARGAGGLILLTRGAAADENIHAAPAAVTVLGGLLALLGLVLIVAALGVLRGSVALWKLGVAATIAFVIDGALNGGVLYGRPGDGGTIVNVVAAGLIVACLIMGKPALRPPKR